VHTIEGPNRLTILSLSTVSNLVATALDNHRAKFALRHHMTSLAILFFMLGFKSWL
jgi:hypothetical protein